MRTIKRKEENDQNSLQRFFSEDTDEWRDYGEDLFLFVRRLDNVPFIDLDGFYIVSSLSALQLHYSKF